MHRNNCQSRQSRSAKSRGQSRGPEADSAIAPGNLSSYNYTALNDALQEYLKNTPHTDQTDGRATEDCLFLDVIVPKAVFGKANNRKDTSGGAPVVVW